MELASADAVIGGDLNLHHTLWGSSRTGPKAAGFVDSLNLSDLVLRNNCHHTRYDKNSKSTTAIDVTFTTKEVLIENWKVIDHAQGNGYVFLWL